MYAARFLKQICGKKTFLQEKQCLQFSDLPVKLSMPSFLLNGFSLNWSKIPYFNIAPWQFSWVGLVFSPVLCYLGRKSLSLRLLSTKVAGRSTNFFTDKKTHKCLSALFDINLTPGVAKRCSHERSLNSEYLRFLSPDVGVRLKEKVRDNDGVDDHALRVFLPDLLYRHDVERDFQQVVAFVFFACTKWGRILWQTLQLLRKRFRFR